MIAPDVGQVRTHGLADSVTHRNRSYTFFHCRGRFFSGVLRIVQHDKQDRPHVDVYGVEEHIPEGWEIHPDAIPASAPMPRYFLVCKCGPSDEGLYLVRMSQGAGIKDACQCFGFSRWGNCKHTDAIYDLLRREEI